MFINSKYQRQLFFFILFTLIVLSSTTSSQKLNQRLLQTDGTTDNTNDTIDFIDQDDNTTNQTVDQQQVLEEGDFNLGLILGLGIPTLAIFTTGIIIIKANMGSQIQQGQQALSKYYGNNKQQTLQKALAKS